MDKMLDVRIRCGGGGFQRADTVRQADVLFEKQAFVSGFEIADVIFGKSAALQADQIQAAGAGGVAIDDHEWRYVLNDFGKSADDRMFPDPAELMDRSKAGNDRVILNRHVPREAAVVGKNDVIAELAVMRDVGVTEKQIVRADAGGQFCMRAAMHRAVFAEHVVISYL